MSDLIGTVLFLSATGLSAVVIEDKIRPLPKWTGPLFLYLAMPALYVLFVAAIAIGYGYL
jgi:hypothetical protein